MKNFIWTFFALAVFTPVVMNAQSVALRKEIRGQSCPDAEIKAVKIGPLRSGYLARCEINGHSDDYVFEKTHLLLNAANISILKTSHLGYYDISAGASTAASGFEETKRWNGSSYTRYRCQEFDVTSRGKSHVRPCSNW